MPVPFDSSRYLFIVAMMFASLTMPVKGEAAEWTAEPSVKLRREYNDNIRLSAYPHNSVVGSIVTPSLSFGVNTPVWQISGGGEATQRRYSGEEGLDQDDNLLRIFSAYKTERSTWQLDANRTRDSVLTNEYISSDTGSVQTHKKRETDSVNPAWIWMFSERTQLQLAYQHADVSYENALSVGLYDYRYRATTATLSNQISELNQVFLSGSYSAFHVPDTGFDSKTRNIQAGVTRYFSEITKGTLQAGLRRTESFTPGGRPVYTRFSTIFGDFLVQTGVSQDVHSQKTGSVFSGNLETKFESTRLNMALSRSLDPSGSGGQIEQNALKIDLSKQLTARMSVYINANANKVRTVEGNISNDERTYYGIGPGVYWQGSREWSVNMNYRYAHVKRVYESEAADSNSLSLSLTYQPLKMSVSR